MTSKFITSDKLADVLKNISGLVCKQVLVGIPDSTTERNDEDDEGPMNNATLGYLHENGSPANNLPARPFLIPGIEDATSDIAGRLRKAADAALDGKADKVDQQLNAAGLIAQNSVKEKISTGDFAPLSPSTVASRRYKRGTKSMRDSEREYMDMIRSGAQAAGFSLAELQDAAGIRPLIDTGQLRDSITYVIRKK